MAEMDFNECQIVKDSITGKRSIDEQTFAWVRFSSVVRKLARQRKAVAVC